MKIKKCCKFIITCLISIIFVFSLQKNVFAEPSDTIQQVTDSIQGIVDSIEETTNTIKDSTQDSHINPDDWKPDSLTSVSDSKKIQTIGNNIIGVIRTIGSILSVVVLIVIGIKYMIGSVEERAEYKKTLLPYVIGAVMVFGITNLLSIIVNLVSSISNAL